MKSKSTTRARRTAMALGALVLMLVASAVTAQGAKKRDEMPRTDDVERPVMPAESEINEAMKRAQETMGQDRRDALDKAVRKAAGSPVGPGKGPGGLPSTQRMPDVSQMIRGGGVDPAKLAEQYGAGQQGTLGEERVYKLLVFASLSMPEESLKRLGRDVKRAGGVIVLRGMRFGVEPGTWIKSVEALKPLAATGADIQINPALFQLFQVKAVPAIVVSPDGVADKGCAEGKCAAGTFAMVVGDVSLDYALETLVDRKDSVGRLSRSLSSALQ